MKTKIKLAVFFLVPGILLSGSSVIFAQGTFREKIREDILQRRLSNMQKARQTGSGIQAGDEKKSILFSRFKNAAKVLCGSKTYAFVLGSDRAKNTQTFLNFCRENIDRR